MSSLLRYNEVQSELHVRSAPAFQASLGSQRTDWFAAKENPSLHHHLHASEQQPRTQTLKAFCIATSQFT